MYYSALLLSTRVLSLGKSISNNIRKLRFDAEEMSQQTLADKVGVTRQTVIAMALFVVRIDHHAVVPPMALARQ